MKPHLTPWARLGTTLLFIAQLQATGTAHAGTVQETWMLDHAPQSQEISQINARIENRGLIAHLADPAEFELQALAQIQPGAGPRTLVMGRYPTEVTTPALVTLAAHAWTLVILDGSYPTDSEIQWLREINPPQLTLALTAYAGASVMQSLAGLPGVEVGRVRALFAARAFPKFLDRDAFRAAPAGLVLEFQQDYWPQYVHMDLFNMIPQAISLRIQDQQPSRAQLPYTQGIERLRRVTVSTPWISETEVWNDFAKIPTQWLSIDTVPVTSAVAEFAQSSQLGPRTLRIDTDQDMAMSVLSEWAALGIDVEYVHSAPIF